MVESGLPVPMLLLNLVERRIWPADAEQEENFESAYPFEGATSKDRERRLKDFGPPPVSIERIRLIHPTFSRLCLYPPPFLPSTQATSIYWSIRDHPGFERFFAEDEIDRDRMIEIGDFGHGSDTPIVLDYQHDLRCPAVLRLDGELMRRDGDGLGTYGEGMYWDGHWIEIAPSFDDFARLLGFID